MTLQDLEHQLKNIIWVQGDKKEIDLSLGEEFLVTTLMKIADTSWGRDTLDNETIGKWLDNFTGELYDCRYERILALILAVHMVYYNECHICHLVKLAYRKLLHEIMGKEHIGTEAAAESLVFLPLGEVSESGPFLSYYFRKENCLPVESFVASFDLIAQRRKVKNIVLMDDVSISGEQADWYIKKMRKTSEFFREVLNEKNVYALFLMSTIDAKEKLKEYNIKLCTPILMDRRSCCFDEESSIYKIFDNSIRDEVRIQSKNLAQYYGCKLIIRQYKRNGEFQRLLNSGKSLEDIIQKVKKDSLGYGNAQMLIAFEYNTPNSTLPIIWIEDGKWKSLFRRYDKLYTKQIVEGIESESVYI